MWHGYCHPDPLPTLRTLPFEPLHLSTLKDMDSVLHCKNNVLVFIYTKYTKKGFFCYKDNAWYYENLFYINIGWITEAQFMQNWTNQNTALPITLLYFLKLILIPVINFIVLSTIMQKWFGIAFSNKLFFISQYSLQPWYFLRNLI